MSETIRLAILQDRYATQSFSLEDERKMVIETLRDVVQLPVKLVAHGDDPIDVIRDSNPDLVTVDYGGLSHSYGAGDYLQNNIRYIRQWADEHPGKLVIIWTPFTTEMYKHTLDDFTEQSNVILQDYFPEENYNKIRAFYGKEPLEF